MSRDEAVKQLQDFCKAFENEEIKKNIIKKYGNLGENAEKDYEATKVMLAENENLNQELEEQKMWADRHTEQIYQLHGIIKQYQEALRKCNPWLLTTNQCLICGGKNNHLDDCEYVRLCGNDINVTTKDGGAE